MEVRRHRLRALRTGHGQDAPDQMPEEERRHRDENVAPGEHSEVKPAIEPKINYFVRAVRLMWDFRTGHIREYGTSWIKIEGKSVDLNKTGLPIWPMIQMKMEVDKPPDWVAGDPISNWIGTPARRH